MRVYRGGVVAAAVGALVLVSAASEALAERSVAPAAHSVETHGLTGGTRLFPLGPSDHAIAIVADLLAHGTVIATSAETDFRGATPVTWRLVPTILGLGIGVAASATF